MGSVTFSSQERLFFRKGDPIQFHLSLAQKDNFGFEDGQRRLMMLGKQLEDLESIRRNIEIIEYPPDNKIVRIGSIVTVFDIISEKEFKYIISSYMTFSPDVHTISYATPLAKLFLTAAVDEICIGIIGSQERSFRITRIE